MQVPASWYQPTSRKGAAGLDEQAPHAAWLLGYFLLHVGERGRGVGECRIQDTLRTATPILWIGTHGSDGDSARQAHTRVSMTRLLILLCCWLAAAYCLQQCAPTGCQPLTSSDFASGACYYLASPASTPALTLQPTSSLNSTLSTWASVPAAAGAQQLPVLDLCNQVQSIWLLQGP